VVTIEDAAELQLQQEHVARMETRPPPRGGHEVIVALYLCVNALRMAFPIESSSASSRPEVIGHAAS